MLSRVAEVSPRFATATDVLDGWRDDVLSARPPRLFPIRVGGQYTD
jgi:hypothetical protein